MAQFKDLVVSGAARVMGTLYAGEIIGDVEGTSKNADTATYDVQGHAITSYIRGLSISGRVISYTKGDGSTASITVPDTSIAVGTTGLAGTTKLYDDIGEYTDGTITQQKLTELLAGKVATSGTVDKANKDGSGQNIANTYIKGLASSGTTVTYTKGDGSTGSINTQDTTYGTGNTSEAGLTKLYTSKGSNTDGTMTQNAINTELGSLDSNKLNKTDGITGFSANGSTVTYTRGDGSTGTFNTANTEYGNASTATAGIVRLADSTGQSEEKVMHQKAVSDALNGKVGTSNAVSFITASGTTVTYTKADGSTDSFNTQDTRYNNATTETAGIVKLADSTGQSEEEVMHQKAVSDALSGKAGTSQAISNITADGSTVTFTKADGSTGSFNTANTEYGSATTATAGVVRLAAGTGQSESDVMTQKAVTEALGGKVGSSQAVESLSANGTTVTYTKADGSTASINTQDTTYSQATDSALGLVKIASATGQSTESVMTQKAVTDELAGKLANASTDASGMKFTKGDGSTFTVNIPGASSATDSTAGIMKLYGDDLSSTASTATDGAPTQAAVNSALSNLESDLTTMIGNIFSTEFYDSIDDLPDVGVSKIFYFVPTSDSGENNNYDEYVWISDWDEDLEEDTGYYELFGSCSIDLADYYTSSATDTAITNATSSLVKSVSQNGTTLTFTKKDNSTFSVNTQDTTYSQFGLSSDGLVPGTSAGQTNYILSGNGWVEKAAKAVNADSATYATNAGTAAVAETCVNAGTSSHATNADSATYATNAGTAAQATNATNSDSASYATDAGSATYATNAGTATRATNADTATYATNAGTAAQATNATSASTAAYATNAGTATKATNADTATYATNAGTADYATNGGTATYATNAGTAAQATNATNAASATHATNADTASYAVDAGSAVYATNSSTATYATDAGNALSAVNADTATYATNAGTAARATNATSAAYAENAGTASLANNATLDSANQNIAGTYIKGVDISGRTITFTKGDGSTTSIQTQDNNTTYDVMSYATSATDGTIGLVPAPSSAQRNYVLTGSGWVAKVPSATNADSATYATNAGTATFAESTGTVSYAVTAGSIATDFDIDCGYEADEEE